MLFNLKDVVVRPLDFRDAEGLFEIFGVSSSIFEKIGIKVLGALWENELIGIVSIYKYRPGYFSLSGLQVISLFQRHGIGHKLLLAAEQECRRNQGVSMRCRADEETYDLDIVFAFLRGCGWNRKWVDYTYFQGKIDTLNKSFIGRYLSHVSHMDYLHGIIVKKWSDVSSDEWYSLADFIDQVPESLHPEAHSGYIVDALTFFLIRAGMIVGWLITTRRNRYEVVVEITYVHPAYRKDALGIKLFGVLNDKIVDYNDKNLQYISYIVSEDNTFVRRLYSIIFRGCIDKITDFYILEKLLV